jgi:hypothetical protein
MRVCVADRFKSIPEIKRRGKEEKRKGSSARIDKPPKEKRWKRKGKQFLEAQ